MARTPAKARSRRDLILEVAERLFTERGFDGTSIDAIGTEVGFTGPAIYYYFHTKHELLAAVLSRLSDAAYTQAEAAVDGVDDPAVALEALVDCWVDHVFDHRGLIATFLSERAHIPAEDLGPSTRSERNTIDLWARVLRRLRPELTPRVTRSTAFAAQWLAYSVSVSGQADTPALRARHVAMARAVLLAPLNP
ncbi:MAG: TetR family transcriptional regulator [Actinomycetia bacterium]|nr:TetR family transcriptional regulator [Actinomycetes bacterium]